MKISNGINSKGISKQTVNGHPIRVKKIFKSELRQQTQELQYTAQKDEYYQMY